MKKLALMMLIILMSMSVAAQDFLPKKASPDYHNKREVDSIQELIEKNKSAIKDTISYEDAYGNADLDYVSSMQVRGEFLRQEGIARGLHMMPKGNFGFPDYEFYYKHPVYFARDGKKLMEFSKTFFGESPIIMVQHNMANWAFVLWEVNYKNKYGLKALNQMLHKYGWK